MNDQLVIRSAVPSEDAPFISDIYSYYVENTAYTFECQVPDADEISRRMEKTQKKYPYLIAEKNGEIVGYTYAGSFNDRAAYDWSVETSIYLKQGQTHSGIGRALYSELCEELTSRSFQMAYANITEANPNSLAFHEALGFSLCGTFEHSGWKNGKWYNTYWMQKPLHYTECAPDPVAAKQNQTQAQMKNTQIFIR